MKKFCFLILVTVIQVSGISQVGFKDITISYNLDSLEAIPSSKIGATQQDKFIYYARLEMNRLMFATTNFGKNINDLEKISNTLSSQSTKAIVDYIKANVYSDLGIEPKLEFELLNSALQTFKVTKDTIGILYCYNLLIIKNTKKTTGDSDLEDSTSFRKKLINNLFEEAKKLNNTSPNSQFQHLWYRIQINYSKFVLMDYNNGLRLAEEERKKNIFTKNKNLETLEYYLNRAFFLFKTRKFTEHIAIKDSINSIVLPKNSLITHSYTLMLGYSYMLTHQFDSANSILKKQIEISKDIKNTDIKLLNSAMCLELMAEIKNEQKDYKAALDIHLKADSFLDARQKLTTIMQFQDVQEKYKANEKEKEKQVALKQKKQYEIFIIIGLILFASISILLVYVYMQNKKLIRLNLFKSKVQSIISHDLRSPLIGLTQLYEQYNYWTKKNDPKQIEKLSNSIDEASNNMSNLLNNILLWTTEIKTTEKQEIELNSTTNNILDLYKNLLQAQNIAVQNNVMQQHKIIANVNVVELILRNWVDNVIKYAKPSEIEFYTKQLSNGGLVFCIKDNGSLDTKNLSKIQAFLNNQQSDVKSVFGLGLSLINEFASKEKWKIQLAQINNENVFSITF